MKFKLSEDRKSIVFSGIPELDYVSEEGFQFMISRDELDDQIDELMDLIYCDEEDEEDEEENSIYTAAGWNFDAEAMCLTKDNICLHYASDETLTKIKTELAQLKKCEPVGIKGIYQGIKHDVCAVDGVCGCEVLPGRSQISTSIRVIVHFDRPVLKGDIARAIEANRPAGISTEGEYAIEIALKSGKIQCCRFDIVDESLNYHKEDLMHIHDNDLRIEYGQFVFDDSRRDIVKKFEELASQPVGIPYSQYRYEHNQPSKTCEFCEHWKVGSSTCHRENMPIEVKYSQSCDDWKEMRKE